MENIGIAKKIDNLYNKSKFLDKYGGSVFMCILILLIFFLILSYFWVMSHAQPIRDNWTQERCNPAVIPFAGLIMDQKNKSKLEFTAENFNGCASSILKEITSLFLIPINAFFNIIMLVWKDCLEAINAIRNVANRVRHAISEIMQKIFSKILGILIPLQKMIISARDGFSKVQGVMASGLFTGLGVYDTMLTGVGAVWDLIMIIFIAITAGIILLLALLFTIPAGLIGLALYIPLAIIFISTLVILSDAMHMSGLTSMPKTPSCFPGDTKIKTKQGEVNLEDLTVGTILENGSKVTSFMKITSNNQNMYNLNGTIVSETHKVLYENNFIYVGDHPQAIKLETFNQSFIYCFNTSNKTITINNFTFCDWDDLDELDIMELKIKTNKYTNSNELKREDIHKYLESGIDGDTLVELENGNSLKLKDVEVNDLLKYGERVLGVVEIDASDIPIYKHIIDGKEIYGGANLQIYKSNLGIFDFTLDSYLFEKSIFSNNKKLYHLLTDKNGFTINGNIFYDYNGAIDSFLDKFNFQLNSMNFI